MGQPHPLKIQHSLPDATGAAQTGGRSFPKNTQRGLEELSTESEYLWLTVLIIQII